MGVVVHQSLKLVAAFSDHSAAQAFATLTQPASADTKIADGYLLSSTKSDTKHLPFAALFVGVIDDLATLQKTADVGVYLVCERTIKNKPLADLTDSELPSAIGIFPLVANSRLGPAQADQHWRDHHAPLALDVHTAMTHYYQLSVMHRFNGPDWNGFALCCFASESDLRDRFFNTEEGQAKINADVSYFADTRTSPRRVIADIRSTFQE